MSFLNQVGVPYFQVRLACDETGASLQLFQSRYVPLGSDNDKNQLWQVPVCAKYPSAGAVKTTCGLIDQQTQTLKLDTAACPDWVMPNAGAGGYYRWVLDERALRSLQKNGFEHLSAVGRMTFGSSVASAFEAGSLDFRTAYELITPLTADEQREVSWLPTHLLHLLMRHLAETDEQRARVGTEISRLYLPVLEKLGLEPRESDTGDERIQRGEVLQFLVEVAGDRTVRNKAQRLGRRYLGLPETGSVPAALARLKEPLSIHPDAVSGDLVRIGLRSLVDVEGEELFNALLELLERTSESGARGHLIAALGVVRDDRVPKALALALNPTLLKNERLWPLWNQVEHPTTRTGGWKWFTTHFDELHELVGPQGLAHTPWLGWDFCSDEEETALASFFEPRLDRLDGGARTLALARESVRLCATRKAFHQQGAVDFLNGLK